MTRFLALAMLSWPWEAAWESKEIQDDPFSGNAKVSLGTYMGTGG